jgi:SnoaL-like polyketide cyclase
LNRSDSQSLLEVNGNGVVRVAIDYIRHDPGDPFPAHGPEDVKRIVTMLRNMLPDFKIEVEAVVAESDMVVSRNTATAIDTQGYMGMPTESLRSTAASVAAQARASGSRSTSFRH